MKKILLLLAFAFLIPACAIDGTIGVSQDPTTGQVTITDPKGGVIGKIATGAQTAGSMLPPPLGTILWGVGSLLSLGVHVAQQVRVGSWKGAALATASGVQDAIGKLDAAHAQNPVAPSAAADIVKAAIDLAHDNHDVPQAIQNVLTPTT